MVTDVVKTAFKKWVCTNITTSHRIAQIYFLATPARDLPTYPTTPRVSRRRQPSGILQPHRGLLATTTNCQIRAVGSVPEVDGRDDQVVWGTVTLSG